MDLSDPTKIMACNALLDARDEFSYGEWQHLKTLWSNAITKLSGS